MTTYYLGCRDTAIVLAGLRLLQKQHDRGRIDEAVLPILLHGDVTPNDLQLTEIDGICEDLNCGNVRVTILGERLR